MANICNYGLKRFMFVLNLARPFKASGSPASAVILSSCCIKNMEDGETAAIDAMRPLEGLFIYFFFAARKHIVR